MKKNKGAAELVAQGVDEAREIMAGTRSPARRREYSGYVLVRIIEREKVIWELAGKHEVSIPKTATTGERVQAIRKALRQSQAGFAELLGISLGTLQGWEQDRRKPNETALRLMEVSYQAPEVLIGHKDGVFA